MIVQWISAHCGIKDKEHADSLAKQGPNMDQDELPITLKQKKTIMKKRFKAKKIPDDYHTLDREIQVTLIRLRTDHNILNSHMHRRISRVRSTLCTRKSNNRTHTAKMTIISENRYGEMEHNYTRCCMGRRKT